MKAILLEQRGSVIIIVAAAMICLLGMAGLVVDVGYAYVQKAKMQNAVDAAAIAGASEIQNTTKAVERAKEYLERNGLDRNKAKIELLKGNRLTVTYSANIRTFFMRAFGFNSLNIGVFAAAEQQPGPTGLKVILVR